MTKPIIAILLFLPTALPAAPSFGLLISSQGEVVEHGGGCRKNSPAGQCCHMDRKAGYVHCH